MKQKEKKEKKSIVKIILNIFFYVILVILILFAGVSIASRVNNGKIGSHQFLVVISASMDGEEQEEYDIKTIPVKSLIGVKLNTYDNEFYSSLKKGDVLTFNYVSLNNETITHRIVEDPEILDDGIYKFTLKGDAVSGNEYQYLYSDGRSGEIIGKVTFVSYPLGVLYFFISSKIGTVVLVIIPSTLICLYEIYRIVFLLGKEKSKKDEAKEDKVEEKDKQIQELQKQIDELKKQQEKK